MILARGARQLVVQDALLTMFIESLSYFCSFTPITNIGASADGALMITWKENALLYYTRGAKNTSNREAQDIQGNKRDRKKYEK